MAANGRVELTSKQETKAATQFGSLGSGNHFFEVCLDETRRSGSCCIRVAGVSATSWPKATSSWPAPRRRSRRSSSRTRTWPISCRGRRSSRPTSETCLWAQDYAMANRSAMMDDAFGVLRLRRHRPRGRADQLPSQLHQREVHDGKELWITRKGAIKADVGDRRHSRLDGYPLLHREGQGRAQLPLLLHGAGRRYSRTKAKKTFTVDDLAEQMKGKAWLSDRGWSLLDEIPSAYKDIDQVMADQSDLVEIQHTLSQVLNYKGT